VFYKNEPFPNRPGILSVGAKVFNRSNSVEKLRFIQILYVFCHFSSNDCFVFSLQIVLHYGKLLLSQQGDIYNSQEWK